MKDFIKNQIQENQAVVKNLQAGIENIGDRRKELEEKMKEQREKNLQNLFSKVTEEFGVKPVQNYEGSYTFRHEDKPGSDLFTIYSREDWREEGYEKAMNFYTTTCDNDFEFRRLDALGKVARLVGMTSAKAMFDIINEGTGKMREEDRELRGEQIALAKAKDAAERAINDAQAKLIEMDLLANGVEFEEPVGLFVGNKLSVHDLVKVKITKKSASGKTCDVETVRELREFNPQTGRFKDETTTHTMNFDRIKTQDLIDTITFLRKKELANTAS